jgi:hypothetical protein
MSVNGWPHVGKWALAKKVLKHSGTGDGGSNVAVIISLNFRKYFFYLHFFK